MRSFTAALVLAAAALAQTPSPYAPIADRPGLPRVLLIGDSISIGYTLDTRALLEGAANVHRIPENAATTARGIAKMDRWLKDDKWDVIHFNFGLHDLRRMDDGLHQVPVRVYERNLDALVRRMKQTGAKLIWASTTPVPEGKVSPPRAPADVEEYNRAAARVMKKHGVAIDDLYAFALPRLKEIQRPVNVHFTDNGSKQLAGEVAAAIRRALRL